MQSSALRALLSVTVCSVMVTSCGAQPNEAGSAQSAASATALDPRTPYRRQPPPVVPRLLRDRPSQAVQRAADSRRPLASAYNTYDYVLKTLDFDESDAVVRRGFNPDGYTSTAADNAGCNHADFQSTMTPALNLAQCASGSQFCTGGVDNALPELMDVFDNSVGLPFRSHANTWIRQGRSYWLMRITYVNDKSNDPEVEAHFYRGFARSSSCAAQLGGNGEFNVDNAYLATPGDISQPLYRFGGSIVNGKLYLTRNWGWSSATTTPVPIVFGVDPSTSVAFNLYQAEFFLDASQLGYPMTGMVGGWANTDALSYSIELAFPSVASQVFFLMPRLSDLANPTTGACDTGTPLAIGGLSMGAGVNLVSAKLLGTAWEPAPTVCGGNW